MDEGLKLKFLIQQQKLSQQEFAKLAGYDGAYISRVIKAGHVPLPMREKVAEVLGYPIEKWDEADDNFVESLQQIPLDENLKTARDRKQEAEDLAVRLENDRLKAQVALLEAHLAQILKMRGEEW